MFASQYQPLLELHPLSLHDWMPISVSYYATTVEKRKLLKILLQFCKKQQQQQPLISILYQLAHIYKPLTYCPLAISSISLSIAKSELFLETKLVSTIFIPKSMKYFLQPFGVKSSPFIATRVLRHIAESHQQSHPRASEAILNSFYVDDFLSGAANLHDADSIRQELCELLLKA